MNISIHELPQDKRKIQFNWLLILVPTIAVLIEAGSMLLLYLLPIPSKLLMFILDLSWTVFIVFPLIGYFLIRPLVLRLEGQKYYANGLEQTREELENKYRNRTLELERANEALNQEIAERKAVVQELRNQEMRLDLILRQLPAVIWATDSSLVVNWVQGASILDRNITHQDITGKKVSDFDEVPVDHPIFVAHLAALSGSSSVFESSFREKTFQFSIEPLLDDKGNIIGCVGLGYDLTELKDAKRQIQLQSAAIESDINAISITDTQGNIVWVNDAFTKISGYSREEVIGKNMRFLKSGEHTEGFYQDLWQTVSQGKMWASEMVNRRKDGSLYHEQQIITPVLGERGKISHFISVKMDITPRKTAEQELRRRNQELEQLNEVGTRVGSLLEPDAIVKTVTDFFSATLQIDAGVIFIKDEKSHNLRLASTWGLENHHISVREIPIDEYSNSTLLGQPGSGCWENSISTLVKDTREQAKWTSCLRIPLYAHKRLFGAIELLHREPDFFKEEQRNFYQTLGSQIGAAVQNAVLFRIEMEARDNAQLLRRAGMAFNASLNLDVILDTLLNYLQALLDYDAAYVVLRNGETEFQLEAERGGVDSYPSYLIPFNASLEEWSRSPGIINLENGQLIPDLHTYLGIHECLTKGCNHSWMVVPLSAGEQGFGYVLLGKKEAHQFNHNHFFLAGAMVSQAAVSVQNAWLFEQVSAGRDRAKLLTQRLVNVQEAERRSLARELHDETSQNLASLLLGLELLERSAHNPEEILKEASKLENLVNNLLNNMHRIAVQLRPANLDQLGLVASIRHHIKVFEEQYRIPVNFETFGMTERFPPDMEITIFRIVQEGLTNIIRHSKANRVDILVNVLDEKITLIIEDNGIGFDPTCLDLTRHLGLIGIRERVEMLGGSLLIDTAPSAGVTLKVEFPWSS